MEEKKIKWSFLYDGEQDALMNLRVFEKETGNEVKPEELTDRQVKRILDSYRDIRLNAFGWTQEVKDYIEALQKRGK